MSRISGDQILVLQNCWWLSGQGLPVVYWPWLQLCRHNCGSASFLSHLLTSHWPKQVIRLSLVLREGTGHCACSAVGEAGCRERWRTGPLIQSTMLGRSPRTATSAPNTPMRPSLPSWLWIRPENVAIVYSHVGTYRQSGWRVSASVSNVSSVWTGGEATYTQGWYISVCFVFVEQNAVDWRTFIEQNWFPLSSKDWEV